MRDAGAARRLRRQLRARAEAEGFDAVGVAGVGKLERDGDALARWLGHGYQAGMAWMEDTAEQRADPAALLPGCRSIVVLAMNYWPGPDPPRRPTARVARYARGRDYHRVMGKKLRRLSAWLEEAGSAPARSFVDTGPVLERAWAERAGVGWIGKNANLIRRDLGSWLLLGEIFSAADLAPDPGPHPGFCGECNACVAACPTGAIVADGVVDANLCVSYWTIEHRGPVPRERRAGIGDWLFGCDDCQTVCPWNERFARATPEGRFERRGDLARPDPERILAMDEPTFRQRYSGTSFMRAKWEGLRRNACIVLGNRRDPAAVVCLAAVLEDADPVVRGHAAWALGRIGGEEARRALEGRAKTEPSPDVCEEIRAALRR